MAAKLKDPFWNRQTQCILSNRGLTCFSLAATPECFPTITQAPSEVSPVKEDKFNPPHSSSSSRIRLEIA